MIQAGDWPGLSATRRDPDTSLEGLVYDRLRAYVEALRGHGVTQLASAVEPQLDRALYRLAMELAEGRQQTAAQVLGVHRNTVRRKLKELGLSPTHGRRG